MFTKVSKEELVIQRIKNRQDSYMRRINSNLVQQQKIEEEKERRRVKYAKTYQLVRVARIVNAIDELAAVAAQCAKFEKPVHMDLSDLSTTNYRKPIKVTCKCGRYVNSYSDYKHEGVCDICHNKKLLVKPEII